MMICNASKMRASSANETACLGGQCSALLLLESSSVKRPRSRKEPIASATVRAAKAAPCPRVRCDRRHGKCSRARSAPGAPKSRAVLAM